MNNLKTVVLLAGLTGLLVLLGRIAGGVEGMIIAFVIAIALNFGSYWFSDKIALGMGGAHEVSVAEAPELYAMVEQLATQAEIPRPRVYIINSSSPNAFATGRDPQHAAIAVTTGIMQILTPSELSGVLAHELAHVKNRDTLIATIVATLAGTISSLAQLLQFRSFTGRDRNGGGLAAIGALFAALLAPFLAMLIQFAVSRSREFEADATGARISGDPIPLSNALEKLEIGLAQRPMNVNPSTAHLYIANPFGRVNIGSWFSTHPPMGDRVARLREMSASLGPRRVMR